MEEISICDPSSSSLDAKKTHLEMSIVTQDEARHSLKAVRL
jgi:hypothetical protein